jgi:prepilin-type N-terminal cleavage/methylation domain-containing protein
MIKRKTGFSLIELLIVMAILGLVLAASSDTFVGLLRQYKQQGKIAETNIEGIIGLELLRQDLETAGYGLPWVMPSGMTYAEAAAGYNDSPAPPRPIVIDHNYAGGLNNADLLVIKAANISRNATSQRWTYLQTNAPQVKTWYTASGIQAPENPASTDYVVVLSPGSSDADIRTLVQVGGTWAPIFSPGNIASFAPGAQDPQPRYVYGISDTLPRMPFNRADYYISKTTVDVPQRCAPNTGVLVKSMISQSNGSRSDHLPLLDCVADMKVIFRIDPLGNGSLTNTDDISTLSAQQIRTQVKEVRVYILAHEGQRDTGYIHPQSTIAVGEFGLQHNFNIGTNVNYRWKVYTIVVHPKNMRQ